MKQEKLNFSIILRIGISLLPIIFGLPMPAMILCSFNIAMSYIVFGPLTCIVSSLCAVCISMFFYGFNGDGAMVYGLFLGIEATLCALACAYTVAKRKSFFSGVWLTAVMYLAPSILELRLQAKKAGVNIAHLMTDAPMELLKAQFSQINDGLVLKFDAAELDLLFESVHKAAMAIVPSILIIVSVVIGYVIMWCVVSKFRGMPGGIKHSFSEIKVPKTMLAVMLASLLVSLLFRNETVKDVALNIFVVLSYMCCFAGLSAVDFFLRKPIKFTVLRILIYFGAAMVMSSLIIGAFMVFGVIDAFADFRKIGKRGDPGETEE